MSRVAQVVLLCEDQQQKVFFYRLLKRLGYSQWDIHIRQIPEGKQSAEQYVREHYPEEVKGHRLNTVSCCLVVGIDADRYTCKQRYTQLENALTHESMPNRQSVEPIAIFIPKRNIETWIKFLLDGGTVNEDTVYPHLAGHESDCHPAVDRFLEFAKQVPPPINCPPSMLQGFEELQRIPK